MARGEWTTDLKRLGRGTPRATRDLLAELGVTGKWSGCDLGSGHIGLRREGRRGMVVVSRSASDWRALRNTRAEIRRKETGQ